MNLTRELLQIVLNDSELQSALLDYDDYSQIDLKDPENLNDHDLNDLKDGVAYVAKNCFPVIRTYETHPLFETSPNPITIYGFNGIYAVIYQEIGFEDAFFFSTEEEAMGYSENAYKTYLDLYT